MAICVGAQCYLPIGNTVLFDRRINLYELNELGNYAL